MRDYLMHYGVLGMKWGVRRYQNPDGSLTAAGKKRYSHMSSSKLKKEFTKQIRQKRSKQEGFSNRWMSQLPIGEYSKSVVDEDRRKRDEWHNSEEYKKLSADANRKWDELNSKLERGEIDIDEYDKLSNKLWWNTRSFSTENWNTLMFAKTISGSGAKYANDFINKGGKDLSTAYLQDLGYNRKTAEYLVKRMLKQGYTLGDI